MSDQKIPCYKFENDHPSYGTDKDVEDDLTVFVHRLGLKENKKLLTEEKNEDKELLKLYVQTHHRAADWHAKSRQKRRQSRELYVWGRIVLLILIPIGVFGLTFFLKSENAVTQATILLTGLIAAFRASSEWMENTFAASNFTKAASELKEKDICV